MTREETLFVALMDGANIDTETCRDIANMLAPVVAALLDAEVETLREALVKTLLVRPEPPRAAAPPEDAPADGVYGSEVLCPQCATTFCPHGERLHFHHDGCPACDTPEDAP